MKIYIARVAREEERTQRKREKKKKSRRKRGDRKGREEGRADRVRWKDSVCSVTSGEFYTRPVYTTIPLTHSTLAVSRLEADISI